MSKQILNSLFIVSPLSKHAGFYQQLISGISSFQELGNRAVKIAEQAQAFRQYDKVKDAAQILANIPIKQYQSIGHYYIALYEYRRGKRPRDIFERIAEYAPAKYRALAMQSLAAMEARKQDYESELAWIVESLKVAPSVEALRGVAIIKGKEGYHRSAVRDLERLLPLIRFSEPLDYYGCLNSYAVELGEAGRREEARNICRLVLASPLALAYPEWQATAEDLRGANRSFVVIDPGRARPKNVLALPIPDRDGIEFPAWAGQPGQVINYEQWKRRMAKKKKNGDKRKPIDEMSEKDLFFELMNLFTSDKLTYEQRRMIFEYAEKVLTEPDKPDPDKPGA